MSEDLKDLAKKALQSFVKTAMAKSEQRTKTRLTNEALYAEEAPKKTDDAMDRQAFRKGGFSKAEKRAYAQQKFVEELVQPPKNPPPAWLNDPTLLPKKPPTRAE